MLRKGWTKMTSEMGDGRRCSRERDNKTVDSYPLQVLGETTVLRACVPLLRETAALVLRCNTIKLT